MKNHHQLINNITGQLNGIQKMIENEKDCFEVLTQLKAVKSALNSLTNKYLEENFIKCIKKKETSKETVCHKFFKEILSGI